MNRITVTVAGKIMKIPGYEHIGRPPDGEPEIIGTPLTVRDIVNLTNYGKNMDVLEELIEEYRGVTEEKVREGLRYYAEHPSEIDELIADSEKTRGTVYSWGNIPEHKRVIPKQ